MERRRLQYQSDGRTYGSVAIKSTPKNRASRETYVQKYGKIEKYHVTIVLAKYNVDEKLKIH